MDWIDAGLKGQQLVPAAGAVTVTASLPHGHVAAAHAMAARLGPPALLRPAGRPRDLALALLNQRDLPREALEALSKNGSVARQRKVQLQLVIHPHTPRHISVPTIRHIYTFELMQVALLPAVPPDVKRATAAA